ncbi:MAG: SDR family NAD(P)-dependent oxidoreductase [Alphaproteobacteria bacterium]|nr:SDR family NAD(P)-dependent oxidoreductase [Rickettsiales bacterium]
MSDKKVALITGASSGMGEDFAKAMIEEGFEVYAVARRINKMKDLKKLGVKTIKMDISKEQDIISVVDKIVNNSGRIDVLINNAGFALKGAVEDVSIEDARYQFEVNIFGLAMLTKLVIPLMRAQKSGKIINISSIGGKTYAPLGAWYYSTKHALEGFSDCLRFELEPFGIDVVIIEPGVIKTELISTACNNLAANSKESAYSKLIDAMIKLMKKSDASAPSPSIITKLVIKAIRAKKPKTRYSAGKYATISLLSRRFFSDRAIDKVLKRTLNW